MQRNLEPTCVGILVLDPACTCTSWYTTCMLELLDKSNSPELPTYTRFDGTYAVLSVIVVVA